jgi:hypothetical protein
MPTLSTLTTKQNLLGTYWARTQVQESKSLLFSGLEGVQLSDFGSEGWGFESLQAHETRFLLTRAGFLVFKLLRTKFLGLALRYPDHSKGYFYGSINFIKIHIWLFKCI